MISRQTLTHMMILLALVAIGCIELKAQKFTVESFRILPNDVTAFITPVQDLNDDDCALIKVEGAADFVFSTPLGIVKREDKVGEIWLYVPRGSKKITLKHPEWGVVRDYEFPVKIDSHVTYELRIAEPAPQPVVADHTPVIETIRDTVVVTRIDTLLIKPTKRAIPFSAGAILTVGFGGKSNTVLGGVLLTAMKRHGAFIHLSTDFGNAVKTIGVCDKTGAVNGTTPYFSGDTRHGCLIINAGGAHCISKSFKVFEGIGYGYNKIAWQLAESEGGGYMENAFYSSKGLSFEVGATFSIKRLMISASVMSISGRQWFGSIGIGVNIAK